MSYPDLGVTTLQEMVLPVDRTIRFEITSLDVLHSFYIPAFLMKTDAVPGRTTVVTLRPTKTGTYEEDQTLRLQCAELCGLNHATMWTPVRVVSDGEFQSWVVSQQQAAATPTPGAGSNETKVAIVAQGTLFSLDRIETTAGTTVSVTLDNQDVGVIHNIAFYRSQDSSQPIPGAATQLQAGPVVQQVSFVAPEPGAYYFRCDVHPTQMSGVLEVK